MKVVLLQDIKHIGKKHDLKIVSDGHALNFLIPRGLARVATKSVEQGAEKARLSIEVDKKVQTDLLMKNLKALEKAKVSVSGKANEKGHLFAGIHKEEIVKLLKDQSHIDITPEFIKLEHPLKEVGEHKVSVEVEDKEVSFTVVVEALK